MARPPAERPKAQTLRFRADLLLRLRAKRLSFFYGGNMSALIENRLIQHVQNEEARLNIVASEAEESELKPKYASYKALSPELKKNVDQLTGLIDDLNRGVPEGEIIARFEALFPEKQKTKTARAEKSLGSGKQPVKEKRAQLRDIDWVSRLILGVSSCGKLVPSEATVLGEFKVPAGKYPDDIFGIRADGDSMDEAKLPDGRKGIQSGDIVICRPLEHAQAEVGKIVVVLVDGETCIKRLEEDAKGKFLAPESTNPAHKAIRLFKHARVQAVVIDKV